MIIYRAQVRLENFSEDTGNISNTIDSQFNKVYVPPKMLGNVSYIPVLMTLDQTINHNGVNRTQIFVITFISTDPFLIYGYYVEYIRMVKHNFLG